MLAVLLNTPQSVDDWARWALHHRVSHNVIRQGIEAQGGANLPEFCLDPIRLDNPRGFLEANSQSHTDMNGALGLPGSDLEDVDLGEPKQLQAWLYLHFLEHQTAEQKLGVSS